MRKFHTFELALLLALAAALLWGAWSLHRQDDLQAKMIRLHVIANSDNAADQALKLQVRDAVLTRAEAILRESADMNDARRRLTDALPAIGDAAAAELHGLLQIGDGKELRAQLTQMAADGHGTMAVGVGLDHAEEAAAGWDLRPELLVVMIQVVERNIRPGSL